MDEYCYLEYCNRLGFDPKWYIASELKPADEDELNQWFDYYFGDDYREFLRHYLYLKMNYVFYGTDLRPDLSKGSATQLITDYKYIDVDCAGLEETTDKVADSIVYGDTSSDTFVLARILSVGQGNIALCAVDFTKNPIPKTDYSGEFVRNLIERTVGQALINEAQDYESNVSTSYYYSGGMPYDEEQLIQSAGSAPVPPLILYAAVLLVYLIGILVVYLVLLKKNRTWKLWVIYPVAALAFAVLIFCLGFSTRVLKLNVNAITLRFPGDVITREEDYLNVTVPKAKEYIVDFSNDVEIDRSFTTDYGSYYSNSNINYDTYAVIYRSDYDHVQSII